MDYQRLTDTIKRLLREKFPDEPNKARVLAGILNITETSVYQKFNGDRQFSLEEIVKIARLFSVSIDTLLGETPPEFTHRMELTFTKNMSEHQRAVYMEETARSTLGQASKEGNSRFTGVCKNMPLISYCYFEWLMRFARMKWLYFHNCLDEMVPLSEMPYPGRFANMWDIYREAFSLFRRLVFIIDGDIIRNYLLDIRFFQHIHYLTLKEVNLVLDDLVRSLKSMEETCREGHTDNPGQEIAILYSDIALYNDIYLVESPSLNQGLFFTQGFIPIIHKDPHSFNVLRECADSCIRSSNAICGVSVLKRNAFLRYNTNGYRNSGTVYRIHYFSHTLTFLLSVFHRVKEKNW